MKKQKELLSMANFIKRTIGEVNEAYLHTINAFFELSLLLDDVSEAERELKEMIKKSKIYRRLWEEARRKTYFLLLVEWLLLKRIAKVKNVRLPESFEEIEEELMDNLLYGKGE